MVDHSESTQPGQGRYPLHRDADIPASPHLPSLELETLAYWDVDGTFQASVEKNPAGVNGSNEFVFYDGPPFANGMPHYGHLLTSYAKDVVPRFQTMRGKRVERRFGWDTHGLPAEMEAMRELGIKTKDEILDIGIEKFNEACRSSVMKYADIWEQYVKRAARWVDFENDYRTMNLEYMESVIWGFAQLWEKGLVYEGFRVLPYCWNDQTPLSNHELRMDDDVYQNRQDTAVTVGFTVTSVPSGASDAEAASDRNTGDQAAGGGVRPGDKLLIWTTTPWTLPANLLAAVGPDITYVVVESDFTGSSQRYILAQDLLAKYSRELKNESVENISEQVVGRLTGAQLAGVSYQPPFNYYQDAANAHKVVVADYVTTTDGTGIVHIAPAFGEEDKLVADREQVATVMPVGPDGCFVFPVTEYEGMQVFDANAPIMEHLKNRLRVDVDGVDAPTGAVTPGTVLVRRESYDHSYPHCWRCRKPLIYMGVSSWFVEVTKVKDRMLELGEQITWTPDHIKHGIFGKWLDNARDWSITRNRFWGTPVPVWKSDDPRYPRIDVYGSLAQLQADFGVEVTDLHRPYIDQLTRPNPDDPTGQSTMRRVEDVMDVWVDSGSMSFAQVHYPFENGDWFEHHFPGDFIVEYIGQTRGWFYVMHVLATALFVRPAFKNCVSHGIVLGDDGRKMSKSLRNFPDIQEVFDRDGSDAMRWFLMSSPILRGGNLIVTQEGIRDAVRTALLPLWSTYYFFTLYANSANKGAGYQAVPVTADRLTGMAAIDRYILAKTDALIGQTTALMEVFDIPGACEAVRGYLDVLTNWYVRTQRDRFWSEDVDAFDTLYTALEKLSRVMAPLAPLTTEEVWRGLTGGRSVHLADWPSPLSGRVWTGADAGAAEADGAGAGVADAGAVVVGADATGADGAHDDADVVAAMDQVRSVVSTALSLRKANRLRVRQPLARLTVAVDKPDALADYVSIITTELNVKAVELVQASAQTAAAFGIVERLAVNARAAGPRLGKTVQAAIKAAKAGDWFRDAEGSVVVNTADGPLPLLASEYELVTVVEPSAGAGQGGGDAQGAGAGQAAAQNLVAAVLPGGGFVVLDAALTEELEAEGYARDMIRSIQDARKQAGLEVADRIDLTVSVPAGRVQALETHRDLVMAETLAVTFTVAQTDSDTPAVNLTKAQTI